MAESGPNGLALRPIAAAEGTSTTAVYSIFGGRAELIGEVSHTASRGFVSAQRAVPVTDDPNADLTNLGRAYRDWALANPTLYLVLMTSATPGYHLQDPIPTWDAADPLRQTIVRLIGAGIFQAHDPNVLLSGIWASVHGFVVLELAGFFSSASREQLDAMYEAQLESIARGWRTT
jgi:AcrR family transcriptional regulator